MTDLGGKSRRYRPKVQYSFSAQAGKLRYFSDYNSTLIERIRRRRAAKTNSRIFAHTRWDAIPVAAALLHCAYFFGMFYLLPRPALGHAHSRFHLLNQHFLEHQRHFPQLHSQSVLPFPAAQSSIQYLGINHSRL